MYKLCKICWEQTPALSCHYRLHTAVQKSAKDRSSLGSMTKEGSFTLPLCVVGGVILLAAIPCICHCYKCKKRKHDSASC